MVLEEILCSVVRRLSSLSGVRATVIKSLLVMLWEMEDIENVRAVQ